MTTRRLSPAALIMAVATVALAVAVFWTFIVHAIAVVAASVLAWKVIRHKLGIKQRPKSSWSSLMRSAAILFASWNTRWFKPHDPKASIPASAGNLHDRPEGWDA